MTSSIVPRVGLLVLDSNDYTRSLLCQYLDKVSICQVQTRAYTFEVDSSKLPKAITMVLLNHYHQDQVPSDFLARLKTQYPQLHLMVIVSPGNEKRALEPLCQTGKIDALFEKPIDPEALVRYIEEQARQRLIQQRLNVEHLNLLRFLPTGSLRRIFNQPEPGHAELFDMTVMFTDIRNSSQWITSTSAQDYFSRLNGLLGAQARLIRKYEGMVVKTTGDGLLAVFEGSARRHLALKCSQRIQLSARDEHVPVGVGLSDGLILTGILGTPEHLHFDVIGAQVHLAARLCAAAQAGQVVASQAVADGSRHALAAITIPEVIQVRGFADSVNCVRIQIVNQESA